MYFIRKLIQVNLVEIALSQSCRFKKYISKDENECLEVFKTLREKKQKTTNGKKKRENKTKNKRKIFTYDYQEHD